MAIPGAGELAVVFEDDRMLAYHHTRPCWEIHIAVACEVEATQGAAAVLTNLGAYQDSKHLHAHVHSGRVERAANRQSSRLRRSELE